MPWSLTGNTPETLMGVAHQHLCLVLLFTLILLSEETGNVCWRKNLSRGHPQNHLFCIKFRRQKVGPPIPGINKTLRRELVWAPEEFGPIPRYQTHQKEQKLGSNKHLHSTRKDEAQTSTCMISLRNQYLSLWRAVEGRNPYPCSCM